MVICHCKKVNSQVIEKHFDKCNCCSIDCLSKDTQAGTGCGGCMATLFELIGEKNKK